MLVILDYISTAEKFFWNYIGFAFICITSLYLTVIAKGLQFKVVRNLGRTINAVCAKSANAKAGISPLRLYFASVGAMVGIGNIVNVGIAVCMGGLGSIFWMVCASLLGSIVKYSEIYLGIKYRVKNRDGGYDGGVMFFLPHAFPGRLGAFLAVLSALLLCIYSIEIYQFVVVANTLHEFLHMEKLLVIIALISLILYVGLGGVSRLAQISSTLIPIFVVLYIATCLYLIFIYSGALHLVLMEILQSAFGFKASAWGFWGAINGFILSGYYGSVTAVYSGDIGIGYDSLIQSESCAIDPKLQAQIAIYALLTDTLLCLLTALAIGLCSCVCEIEMIEAPKIMLHIMELHLPFSKFFITTLIFFAGYTTITAFFTAGIKSANFLWKEYGKYLFIGSAICMFTFFSYFTPDRAQSIMQMCGGVLMLINTIGIIRLRKQIDFNYND